MMLGVMYFVKFYFFTIGIIFTICFIQIASLYSDLFAQGPSKAEYDYIIVGAGTAGTTIFSGMNSNLSIILIDAGSMPWSFMDIPIITPLLHRTRYDWDYETTVQKGACKALKNKKSRWSAGKGFGGSSIINNMISHWGHKEDFRGVFGNPEDYNYDRDILPYFKDDTSPQAADIKNLTKFGEALLKMGKHKGVQFRKAKLYQRDGWRWTIAHDARKQIAHKSEIVTGTLVTKVIFSENRPNEVYATGVQLTSMFGKTRDITARYGVILSAGAIGTPKVLMQSGIGLCDEIALWGINCRSNLPVGRNLQDHVATGLDLITLNTSLEIDPLDLVSIKNINDFLRFGSGPLSLGGCEALGSCETDGGKSRPQIGFMAIPLGITADLGVFLRHATHISDKWWDEYFQHIIAGGYKTVSILPILLHPKSRGVVRLGSNDPFAPPIINPRYFEKEEDVEILVKGLMLIEEFVTTPELKRLGAEIYNRPFPGCEDFVFKSKSYWDCYARHLTLTAFHPVGTCRMGEEKDSRTVVNRGYRVKGTENLFVVDASILPSLPSGNPNAVVAMLAKRFLKTREQNNAGSEQESYHREEL